MQFTPGRAKVFWLPGAHGKGYGLFSSSDRIASDIILVEPGFAVIPESPQDFSPPFPGPGSLGEKGFASLCFHIWTRMGALYNSLVFNSATVDKHLMCTPEELKFLQIRESKTPLYDHIVNAVIGQMLSLEASNADLKGMIGVMERFFADAGEYKDPLDDDTITAFGFMTGSINHSCQPNAELYLEFDEAKTNGKFKEVGPYRLQNRPARILLQAIRPIETGEEITISYNSELFHGNRKAHLQYIKNVYGFDCRCDACVHEEADQTSLELKDYVFELLKEIEEFENIPARKVYQQAAYILDGMAALGVDDHTVTDVWDMCAERAWSSCDMIRAYWFSTQALEQAKKMYGDPPLPERSEVSEAQNGVERAKEGKGLNQKEIQGYSVVPEDGFDMEQEGLEEIMFMLNHDNKEDYYYCLHVVNGKIQEIGISENRKRLARIQAGTFHSEPEAAAPKKKSKKKKTSTVATPVNDPEAAPVADGDGPALVPSMAQEVAEEPMTPNAPLAPEGPWAPIVVPGRFAHNDADPNGLSKQDWLANGASNAAAWANKPRDIGHLLAAKDGYAINNMAYVLSARRDSVCGRVEGRRGLVELCGGAARRARTHSIGGDQGRLDALKLADVRESREF